MSADNLHLVNRPGAAATAAGCALVPGVAVLPFSVAPGQEQVLSFPAGTIGGPVQLSVYSGPALLASQRGIGTGTTDPSSSSSPSRG